MEKLAPLAPMPIDTVLAPEPLVFVDLETSGTNFASNRIIEIGLIEVDADGAREWSVLVNPEVPISSFITGLTGGTRRAIRTTRRTSG